MEVENVRSRQCLSLPLYDQLEIVAGSHDDILRVLVPQVEHVGVVHPDNCIAGLEASCFRRRAAINLQCAVAALDSARICNGHKE